MEQQILHRQPQLDLLNQLATVADEQLKEIMDHLNREALSRTMARLALQERKMADLQQEVEASRAMIEQVKEQQEAAIAKGNYFQEVKQSQEYVNLTNLGRKIIPTITHVRMIKLLRWARIMQVYDTVPYADFMYGKQPLVKQVKGVANNGHEYLQYQYHATRTWSLIDTKLKAAGLLIEFKLQRTTEDLHNFIDTHCGEQRYA